MASLTCVSCLNVCATLRQHRPFQNSAQRAGCGARQGSPARIQPHLCRTSRHCVSKRVSCSAGNFEEGELIKGVKAGDKLKVSGSRIVYHAPKHQNGLDLKDKEGTLIEVIEKYQGKPLSANLPYKTQFMIPKGDGKEIKLIVHLAAGEFEKVGEA